MILRVPRQMAPRSSCTQNRVLATFRQQYFLQHSRRCILSQSIVSQSRTYATPPTSPSDTHAEAVITPASPPPSSARNLRSQIDPAPPPPPGSASPRRRTSTILIAALSLMLGITAGQWVRYVIAPPDLPLPDSSADIQLSNFIRTSAEKLPMVMSMEMDPEFVAWDAYSAFSKEEKKRRLTSGPLGGSRGIGSFQRVYKNLTTGEFISVVWIGGGVNGFPGVCHGGLIATILDESLGRCAISKFSSGSGVTANLELSYLAPVLTNSFYVVRAVHVEEGSTDRKGFVSGRVEGLDGRVHVEAKALFVAPKAVKLAPLREGF